MKSATDIISQKTRGQDEAISDLIANIFEVIGSHLKAAQDSTPSTRRIAYSAAILSS